jgi:2-hydroxycyclohexanecarboxyl-CoA dehydrogenase
MELGLTGKAVIVTGGGSNIGRAISLAFAKEGSNVVIAEVDETQAQKVASEANALGAGGRTVVIKTDVTKMDQVEAMVKKTVDEFGSVDVLVNNVGWTIDRLFLEKPREEWQREIDLNFWSDINCIRAVLPHMVERKKGNVVSIGSDAGRMGEYREAVYGGCKAAVISMSKTIAREIGRFGVRLNVVCPGMTPGKPEETGELSLWRGEMASVLTPEALEKAVKAYPLRKLGKPEDVANAVVFLASDAASNVTGQTLSVSGGYTMM